MTDRSMPVLAVDGVPVGIDEAARAVTIGRDPTCDIHIDSPGVSRNHAVIRKVGGTWTWQDASSSGSYVDGQRVGELAIVEPTSVRVGHPTSGPVVTIEPSTASPAPPPLVRQDRSGLRLSVDGVIVVADEAAAGITIGRDPTSDVHIDSPGVSRNHAAIRRVAGTWTWQDASSSGSYVDGQRVGELAILQVTSVRVGHPTSGPLVTIEPVVGGVVAADPFRTEPAQLPSVAPEPPLPSPPPVTAPRPHGRPVKPVSSLGSFSVTHALQDVLRIGRAPENDLVFADDLRVSRYHAELRRTHDRLEIVDLGSQTGTFVDGIRVTRQIVVDGAVIGIDRHLLILRGGHLEEYLDDSAGLVAQGLTVRTQGGQVLVSDLTLAIEPGSLVAVVGPTGAGKSTAMKALTGFAPAQQGNVSYNGRDVYRSMDELRHRIGYVPQDDILHAQLPLKMALLYAAKLRFAADVTWRERHQRVDEVLDELGLSDRADLAISKLSGGQRKRASVALELLTRPALLFLDEPTSGLDPGFERSIMELLRTLADSGRTVVVVTHSVASLELCDRVLVLAPGGSTSYFGPPGQMLAYFGARDHAQVFTQLETERGRDWAGAFRASPSWDRYVGQPMQRLEAADARPRPPSGAPTIRRRGAAGQLATLTRRTLRVMLSSPGYTALLVLQAPVISVLVLVALGSEHFVTLGPLGKGDPNSRIVMLVVVLAVGAMGLVNACREIVRELPIYQRERVVGLSPAAYLLSKMAILGGLAVVQTIVVMVILIAPQQVSAPSLLSGSSLVDIGIILLLTILASTALGLAVSAGVSTDAAALVLVPVLIVSQLVLANAAVSLPSPGLAEAAYVSPSYWGFAGVASASDLKRIEVGCLVHGNGDDGPGIPFLPEQVINGTPRPPTCSELFDHEELVFVASASALVVLTMVYLLIAALGLRRRDPLRRHG